MELGDFFLWTHRVRLKELLKLEKIHSMKFRVLLVFETIDFSCF
jgi:hypothetical protein